MTEVHELRERISQLIEVAGSQNAFARLAGKSSGAVTNWFRGATPFDSTLQEMAKELGVSLEWLAHGKGDSKEELEKLRRRLETQGGAPRKQEPTPNHPPMISDLSDAGGLAEEPGGYAPATASLLTLETLTRIIREIRLNQALSAEERWRRVQPYQEELERRLETKH